MTVLVIGGGIGGLTTALSLAAAGIEVEIFEQVPTIEALGVGINLQPNAVRELTELGLGDALKSVAIETSTSPIIISSVRLSGRSRAASPPVMPGRSTRSTVAICT